MRPTRPQLHPARQAGRRCGLAAAVAVAAVLTSTAGCSGPLGPIAGRALSGEAAAAPPDWAFTREVMIVQLETRRGERPYSVNVGCIDHAGAIYVGSANPEDSQWIANMVANPEVRLRVESKLYDLHAVRVTNPAEWAEAGRKLYEKYDLEVEEGKDPGWLFRLDARSDAKSEPAG